MREMTAWEGEGIANRAREREREREMTCCNFKSQEEKA